MKLVKSEKGGSDYGLIGQGIKVSGDISFSDQLSVEGKVTGKIASASGTLTIGETGQIEAQVDVGTCIIHGSLVGDLIAKSRVEIRRTGKVHGDVITPVLIVEEGAVFNGAIKMSQQLESVPAVDAEADAKRMFKGVSQ
jgi:cytoskeletal protein CcmA (bactofilin family)